MARAHRSLFALIVLGSAAACMTNHDALELKPNNGSGAGAGGAPSAGGAFTQIGGGAGGAANTGGHPDDEVPGTSVLTFVHGVVDAPSVALCFAKAASDGTLTPIGKPVTAKPIAYGGSVVLDSIAGADLGADVIVPVLLAGDFTLISGKTCQQAIAIAEAEEAAVAPAPVLDGSGEAGAGGAAGSASAAPGAAGSGDGGAAGAPNVPDVPEVPARLRARNLPAIPAQTLNGGRSYLLVANGCIGGSAFSAPGSDLYCGVGYSEREPTLSATLVALSRASAAAHVGMQVVHASLATDVIDVRARPPAPATDYGVVLVQNLLPGQLGPRPALLTHTAFDYYGSTGLFHVEVFDPGGSLFSSSWASALANGGLKPLTDGTTYALVLVGPRADQPATDLWNPPALTVVAADPK